MSSTHSDDEIRSAARARIAEIFGKDVEAIADSRRFGSDLDASFVSDFRHNELDRVDFDIRDAATKEIRQRLDSGEIVIRTVGDYCEHLVRCWRTSPAEVLRILRLDR